MHNFADSLALSHEQEDALWWDEIYGKAFPGHLSAVSVRNDGWAQRGGIDRVVTLQSGKVVTIDEKVRQKSYGDILLEYWSNRENKVPGWIAKDLACDFIAYAFIPDQTCYLLPFFSLRRAWRENHRDWVAMARNAEGGYRIVEAQNPTYVTESVAVPIPDLLSAISQAQIVSWT